MTCENEGFEVRDLNEDGSGRAGIADDGIEGTDGLAEVSASCPVAVDRAARAAAEGRGPWLRTRSDSEIRGLR